MDVFVGEEEFGVGLGVLFGGVDVVEGGFELGRG